MFVRDTSCNAPSAHLVIPPKSEGLQPLLSRCSLSPSPQPSPELVLHFRTATAASPSLPPPRRLDLCLTEESQLLAPCFATTIVVGIILFLADQGFLMPSPLSFHPIVLVAPSAHPADSSHLTSLQCYFQRLSAVKGLVRTVDFIAFISKCPRSGFQKQQKIFINPGPTIPVEVSPTY